MGCSEKQMAANRANAAKSTGPRTAEGKERSRRNALKHGLTGAGIVLPTEDEAAIEARFAEFEADFRPEGGRGPVPGPAGGPDVDPDGPRGAPRGGDPVGADPRRRRG